MSQDDLVTIASYGSPQEASIARGTLATENIPSYLLGDEVANTLWHVGTALGGVKLQVAKRHVSRATDILGAIRSNKKTQSSGQWICSNCNEEVDEGFEICWSCGTFDERRDVTIGSKPNDDPVSSISFYPTIEQEEIEGAIETEADDMALRVWRSAIYGIFFLPLLLCSMFLIVKLTRQLVRQGLSPMAAQHFYGAMAIVLVTTAVLLGLFLVVFCF